MEATTAFDLSSAIQNWRSQLAQSPAFRSENLNELESHLRDSITTLLTRGLSAEEAFLIAARRIGKDNSLETEFGKVNGKSIWLERVLWMLIGILLWEFVSGTVTSAIQYGLAFSWPFANQGNVTSGAVLPIAVFALLQSAGVVGALIVCWWLLVKGGPRFATMLKPLLARRSTWLATLVSLSVFMLVFYVLSHGLFVLLVRFRSVEAVGRMSLYSGYAQNIVMVLRMFGLLAITLLLARKRICTSRA